MEVNTERQQLQYPGIVDNEGTFQMLIISAAQHYLEPLQKSLHETREAQKDKRTYNLSVHISKSVSDVFSHFSPEEFKVDYVVLLADLNNTNCFIQLETELKSFKLFFGREKICLVNPNSPSPSSYFQEQELWDFATQHQLNLICGKVLDDFKINNLSKRILNLAELCCGITNGIPLVSYV